LSYLPSAHIADRVSAHYLQMTHGTEVTTVDDAKRIAEALADARPTFWFAVPRVWEKIKLALGARLSAAPAEQAQVVSRALEVALKRVRARQAGVELAADEEAEFLALDQAVLAPMRAAIGFDRMRWAMSGAASIAPETLEFFMALGLKIVEIWLPKPVTAMMQMPAHMTEFFVAISSNKYVLLMWLNIMLLVLGTALDLAPLLLICTPILLPVVKSFGIDPVHFGIVMLLNLGIGLLTPPVGTTLFVGCAIGKVSVDEVMRGIWPFYYVMFTVLMIVTYVPWLSLALPRAFGF
jgi:hypothetical protein